MIAHAREKADVLIGIHVRLSDYRNWRQGAYYYDPKTYVDLIRRAGELLPDRRIGFLVCADERLSWESLADIKHTFGTGVPVEDLYAFAECDYLIGPPSSFTGWASFYGGVPRYVIVNPRSPIRPEGFSVNRELAYPGPGLVPQPSRRRA